MTGGSLVANRQGQLQAVPNGDLSKPPEVDYAARSASADVAGQAGHGAAQLEAEIDLGPAPALSLHPSGVVVPCASSRSCCTYEQSIVEGIHVIYAFDLCLICQA